MERPSPDPRAWPYFFEIHLQEFRSIKEGSENVNVAIEIPDEVARQLAASSGEVSRAVLEAVAIEVYRSGAITPAQVQQMMGLHSRWETEALLVVRKPFTTTQWMISRGISMSSAMLPGDDRRRRRFAGLLLGRDR